MTAKIIKSTDFFNDEDYSNTQKDYFKSLHVAMGSYSFSGDFGLYDLSDIVFIINANLSALNALLGLLPQRTREDLVFTILTAHLDHVQKDVGTMGKIIREGLTTKQISMEESNHLMDHGRKWQSPKPLI